jgi:excisionase family DNA binding protein
MQKRHLNIKELAEYTGYSTKTIRRWVDQRLIPFWRSPGGRGLRFDVVKIDRWIENNSNKAVMDLVWDRRKDHH